LQPEIVHVFQESLDRANDDTPEEWLEILYKESFPGVYDVRKVHDLELQRVGVDTVLILKNGKRIYIDEKVRGRDYGDVLLEEFSIWRDYPMLNGAYVGPKQPARDWQGVLTPGWLCGEKQTDYIAYIIKPSQQVYFLPFFMLQRAWMRHYPRWLYNYGRIPVPNKGYTTTNIAVPIDVLYAAMAESYRIAA